uniref:MFS domain-containing protein n=1 Tax=Macrostomum lignano TaxID=282301 RepID=A0A1I8FR99_9PLAT
KSSVHWSNISAEHSRELLLLGLLVLQIPAGIVATRYPATLVYSLTTLGSSVINILLPLCIRSSAELTIVARVLQGLLVPGLPTASSVTGQPPLEAISSVKPSSSAAASSALSWACCRLAGLASAFGWPVMFYLYGALGVAWFCVFHSLLIEKPSSDRCITDEEREYIEIEIGESFSSKHVISPALWLKIFTSMPVYAIIVANFVRKLDILSHDHGSQLNISNDVFGYGMSKCFGVRGLFLLGVGTQRCHTSAMIIGVGFSAAGCMAVSSLLVKRVPHHESIINFVGVRKAVLAERGRRGALRAADTHRHRVSRDRYDNEEVFEAARR